MASKEISVELLDIYKTYADQINISANLSTILHKLRDIKASGNEVEIAFRTILSELLPEKYKVGNVGVSEICYTLFRGKLTTLFAGKEMQQML